MKKRKSVKNMLKQDKKRLKEEKRLAKKEARKLKRAEKKAKAGGKKVARLLLKFSKAISKMKPESRIHFVRAVAAKKKFDAAKIVQFIPKVAELNKTKRESK